MRKALIAGLLAATIVPGIASAQSYGEVRRDRRDVRDEQRDVRDARRETREDWRDYRRAHPDAYRGARYVGPRGYAYRPVAVGYRFQPQYYSQRYWIDPARYRLGPVAGNQRWIRYGNDAVLVDMRSGRTIRVYDRFFF